MSQAERRRDFPYNQRKIERAKNLVVLGNGIDMEPTHNASRGMLYEGQCFRYLVSNLPEGRFAFGAGLVDKLFDRAGLRQKIKPDALTFDTSNPQQWLLVGIYEFKSGKLENTRKVKGFSTLINFLSKHQPLFYNLVKDALPPEVTPPISVLVPPEDQIEIGFIINTGTERIQKPRSKCMINFHYLPFNEAQVSRTRL